MIGSATRRLGLGRHAPVDPIRALQALRARAASERPAECREIACRFAGRPARLRIVGRALADTMAIAFGHLASDDTEPELTIDLWDESLVQAGADADGAAELDRSWLGGGGVLSSAFGGRLVRHQLPHTTVWIDRGAHAIVGSVTAAGDLSLYERGKPLHYVLSLWHNDRRAFVAHGALVGRHGSGVLLAGVGGSGKSTLAAACLSSGYECLGDDCIATEWCADGHFRAHSLFASLWLDDEALGRLPALSGCAVGGTRPGEDKAVVEVGRNGHPGLARAADIVAIGLPRIARLPGTRVRPAGKAEALRALGPSTILLFAPSPGAEGLRHLGALVNGVPSFWIDLGEDPAESAAAVGVLLESVGARVPATRMEPCR